MKRQLIVSAAAFLLYGSSCGKFHPWGPIGDGNPIPQATCFLIGAGYTGDRLYGGGDMNLNLVMGLNFLVNLLLLLAANRLSGFPPQMVRTLLAAALGGLYAGACLVPSFAVLKNLFWQGAAFICVAMIAFGFHKSSLRRGAVFVLLHLALIGVAGILDDTLMLALGALLGLCFLADHISSTGLVPVELSYGDKNMKITALRDTGNTLLDPVTGSQVLVVGADVAGELTGLSKKQLQSPVQSITALPGLRLIPYHSVGKNSGMLLALRIPNVKIGHWQGSSLVAFAPEGLSSDGKYQALTGGTIG